MANANELRPIKISPLSDPMTGPAVVRLSDQRSRATPILRERGHRGGEAMRHESIEVNVPRSEVRSRIKSQRPAVLSPSAPPLKGGSRNWGKDGTGEAMAQQRAEFEAEIEEICADELTEVPFFSH